MRDRVPAEAARQGRYLRRRMLGVYIAVSIRRGEHGIPAVLDSLARHAAVAVIRYGLRNGAIGRIGRTMVIVIRVSVSIRPQRAVVIDAGGNGRDVLVRVVAPRNVRNEVRPVCHDDARQAVHGIIAVVLGSHQRFARPPDVRCYTILFPLCATRIPPLYTSISSGNTGTISQRGRGEKVPASHDSVGYGI